MDTVQAIETYKIVVILRGILGDDLLRFAHAAHEGGIRLLECTFDASDPASDELIAANIEMLAREFGDEMQVGAGTVLTKRQVELTAKAGGRFIISPDFNEEIVRYTKACGLCSIPGAITPTEVASAHRAGADFVKLFPINYFGSKYVKDLCAPLSHVKKLAVGGITAENLCEYLGAGACGVGVGSGIANKSLIAAGDFAGITGLALAYTSQL